MELYVDHDLRRLAGGILEQAGKDYFDLLRGRIAPKGDCNIQECEAFFRSPWFSALCTDESDGERIIEIIRKEALCGTRKNVRKQSKKITE